MSKVIVTIPVHFSSKRLRGKILMPINGEPLLKHTIQAVAKAQKINEIWILATKNQADDPIIKFCETMYDVHWMRGDEENILSRILLVANKTQADIIVNVDGEQPMQSPWVIDKTVEFIEQGYPFFGQIGIPLGVRCYGFTRDFLKLVYGKKKHTTENWWKLFEDTAQEEMPQFCVDTEEDYIFVKSIMEKNL